MKIAIECKYEKVKQRGAREGKKRVLYPDETEICGEKKDNFDVSSGFSIGLILHGCYHSIFTMDRSFQIIIRFSYVKMPILD